MDKVSLPISYSINSVYESTDTRFLNVTIDVMHLGENLNGSYFDKETVENELDSIKNTPILGYINSNEEKDFEGHEYDLEDLGDGDYRMVYSGHAYGVIPESCNPRWVTKVASDGVSREYLQVDALMWTKFNDALDIMKRDNVKAQSMEIAECYGDYQEDGLFHFTSFKFDGCCILSTTDPNIQPAMVGANVTSAFSLNGEDVVSEIKAKLSEYQCMFNASACDGKETTMENTITNVVKENVNLTDSSEKEVAEQNHSISEKEVKSEDEKASKAENLNGEKEQSVDKEHDKDNKEFSIGTMQLLELISTELEKYKCKSEDDEYEYCKYWIIEVVDDEAIVRSMEDGKLYGIKYTVVDEVTVSLDMENLTRKVIKYVNAEETEEENQMDYSISKIKSLQKECQEYRTIKPKYDRYVELEEQAKKDADDLAKNGIIESYSLLLENVDGFNSLIERSKDMTAEEVQMECSALFVKNKKPEQFSQDSKLQGNILEVEVEKHNSAIVERYGIELIK